MKSLKIISHPATLIISFLALLISGEHLGGFYLIYILIALPYGAVHSILGVIGILAVLFSNYKYKRLFNNPMESIINVVGAACLALSLFTFFSNDTSHYNYGTFYQTVPMITLVIFIFINIIFVSFNLFKLLHRTAST